MNYMKTQNMLPFVFLISICLCIPLSAMAETDHPAVATASDFIKELAIKGDLRIRYEYSDPDKEGEESLERMRARFRMGLNWDNPDENWKVAAGLCTGGSDANSSLATYSNDKNFETGDIRLDYAYAEHKLDNFKFLAGQLKNPYATSWALWDSDVRPAGFTAAMNMYPAFMTAGVYQVRYINKDIARMEAVQIGARTEMLTVAVAFYNYHRVDEFILKDGMDKDYAYEIVDFYVTADMAADAAVFTPYAQIFCNLGADGEKGQSIQGGNLDPEEENIAYVVGVDTKINRFKLGVAWARIGADSVIPDLKDSNFGNAFGSTDVQGFKLNIGFALTKHFSVSGTAYLTEAKKRDLDQDAKIYQVDLDYKF